MAIRRRHLWSATLSLSLIGVPSYQSWWKRLNVVFRRVVVVVVVVVAVAVVVVVIVVVVVFSCRWPNKR